jgi:hypothetical protein
MNSECVYINYLFIFTILNLEEDFSLFYSDGKFERLKEEENVVKN